MKTFSESKYYLTTHIRRGIGLLLTTCFCMSLVFLAIHHHEAFSPLKNCAICKAKTSSAGTFTKVKANFAPIIAMVNHPSQEIYFTISQIGSYRQRPFVSSFQNNPFLNKAPPVIS